ncbi:hypothetical protein KAR91_36585 [Candidatus Pacearchaeota archaeon]|nr:hypothetical protein [Candidatus Pacearchaeota archaeon]
MSTTFVEVIASIKGVDDTHSVSLNLEIATAWDAIEQELSFQNVIYCIVDSEAVKFDLFFRHYFLGDKKAYVAVKKFSPIIYDMVLETG